MTMKSHVILLVEDNPFDEELSLRALARGHPAGQVVVAHDGVEAMDYLLGRAPPADGNIPSAPAVVLLDLKLPKIDGLEVLRRIRSDESLKHLPVFIMTSSKEQEDILASSAPGASGCLRKPINFQEFKRIVLQAGIGWFPEEEPSASSGREQA